MKGVLRVRVSHLLCLRLNLRWHQHTVEKPAKFHEKFWEIAEVFEVGDRVAFIFQLSAPVVDLSR